LGSQQAGQNTQNTQSHASLLSQLFGNQQNNALQAALGLPGAFSGLSQLPGNLAQQLSTIGQTGFNQQQQNIQNQFSSFTQQQSLIPQLLSFLGGTGPQQYGPSPFQSLTSAANTGTQAAAVAAAK
jgi:hypothetical protein